MITLRLFETANPFHQIAERSLDAGDIVVGRDPLCDWPLEDASGDVSRRHCTISRRNGLTHVVDTSSNGLMLGTDRKRIPRGEPALLTPSDTIHFGPYFLMIDTAAEADASDAPLRPAQARGAAPAGATDAALLEYFCIGARLEPSSLAGEDPAQLMKTLGAVYRQAIDDLCDLMRERSLAKDQLQIDRTTISARDNNPLKWASPESIAVELLQESEKGFLKGAEAFKASFADLRRHGDCLAAASRAAVDFVLEELDPDALESETKRLPLAFTSRHEAAWKKLRERYAGLRSGIEGSQRIEGALRAGYQAHLSRAPARDGGDT